MDPCPNLLLILDGADSVGGKLCGDKSASSLASAILAEFGEKKKLESDASNVSVRQSQGEADRMIDFVVRMKEIVIIIN